MSGRNLINTINHTPKEDQLNKAYESAKEALSQYIATIKGQLYMKTFESCIYNLLGQRNFEDALIDYECNTINLLEALANPAVNSMLKKHMPPGAVSDLAIMVRQLHDFFNRLNSEIYKRQLELFELSMFNNQNSRTTEEWEELGADYTRRLQAEMVRTGKAKAVPVTD